MIPEVNSKVKQAYIKRNVSSSSLSVIGRKPPASAPKLKPFEVESKHHPRNDVKTVDAPKTGLRSFGPGKRKRFIWSEDLHKQFLLSIFQIGLEKAKPRLIFDEMQPAPEEMSQNQVKRHLAKYRGDPPKTDSLFLANLDSAMSQAREEQKLQPVGGKVTNAAFHVYPLPRGEEWEVPMFEAVVPSKTAATSISENDGLSQGEQVEVSSQNTAADSEEL